jgi:replicative DNA helicase
VLLAAGGILTDADIDALLQDMEAQIMEEIQAEVAELERQEQEQLQHAADTVEQHMQYLQQQQQQHTGQGEHADNFSSGVSGGRTRWRSSAS